MHVSIIFYVYTNICRYKKNEPNKVIFKLEHPVSKFTPQIDIPRRGNLHQLSNILEEDEFAYSSGIPRESLFPPPWWDEVLNDPSDWSVGEELRDPGVIEVLKFPSDWYIGEEVIDPRGKKEFMFPSDWYEEDELKDPHRIKELKFPSDVYIAEEIMDPSRMNEQIFPSAWYDEELRDIPHTKGLSYLSEWYDDEESKDHHRINELIFPSDWYDDEELNDYPKTKQIQFLSDWYEDENVEKEQFKIIKEPKYSSEWYDDKVEGDLKDQPDVMNNKRPLKVIKMIKVPLDQKEHDICPTQDDEKSQGIKIIRASGGKVFGNSARPQLIKLPKLNVFELQDTTDVKQNEYCHKQLMSVEENNAAVNADQKACESGKDFNATRTSLNGKDAKGNTDDLQENKQANKGYITITSADREPFAFRKNSNFPGPSVNKQDATSNTQDLQENRKVTKENHASESRRMGSKAFTIHTKQKLIRHVMTKMDYKDIKELKNLIQDTNQQILKRVTSTNANRPVFVNRWIPTTNNELKGEKQSDDNEQSRDFDNNIAICRRAFVNIPPNVTTSAANKDERSTGEELEESCGHAQLHDSIKVDDCRIAPHRRTFFNTPPNITKSTANKKEHNGNEEFKESYPHAKLHDSKNEDSDSKIAPHGRAFISRPTNVTASAKKLGQDDSDERKNELKDEKKVPADKHSQDSDNKIAPHRRAFVNMPPNVTQSTANKEEWNRSAEPEESCDYAQLHDAKEVDHCKVASHRRAFLTNVTKSTVNMEEPQHREVRKECNDHTEAHDVKDRDNENSIAPHRRAFVNMPPNVTESAANKSQNDSEEHKTDLKDEKKEHDNEQSHHTHSNIAPHRRAFINTPLYVSQSAADKQEQNDGDKQKNEDEIQEHKSKQLHDIDSNITPIRRAFINTPTHVTKSAANGQKHTGSEHEQLQDSKDINSAGTSRTAFTRDGMAEEQILTAIRVYQTEVAQCSDVMDHKKAKRETDPARTSKKALSNHPKKHKKPRPSQNSHI